MMWDLDIIVAFIQFAGVHISILLLLRWLISITRNQKVLIILSFLFALICPFILINHRIKS